MTQKRIIQTEHPYIIKIEGVCSGRPILRNPGIMAEDIILEEFPFLTHAQIQDALSYYYDHLQRRRVLDAEVFSWKAL